MNTILLFAVAGIGAPGQALQCLDPSVNRGDIKAGPPLIQTFDLAHKGAAGTITITRVEAGCGCLRRSLTASVLQPGESARLALEINTLTQPDGPNRWQAVVGYRLDLPAAPGAPPAASEGEVVLTVSAKLSRDVSLAPAQIGFSTTGEASQTITLSDQREKPLTVLKASTSSPHLTAEIHTPTAGPGGARIQTVSVKLAADAPVGHREEAVVLLTDDAAYPEFRVPVRVLKRVTGGVRATPDAVNVRLAPGQGIVSTLIQLRSADGKPISIASVESGNPAVAVKWSPGSARVAALRVTVAGGPAAAAGETAVRVLLAEPVGAELAIPVSWK